MAKSIAEVDSKIAALRTRVEQQDEVIENKIRQVSTQLPTGRERLRVLKSNGVECHLNGAGGGKSLSLDAGRILCQKRSPGT